jgi:HEAT repeat protein
MKRTRIAMTFLQLSLTVSGCHRDERGPVLSGGREVKSWLADLHDPKPTLRRNAVLKLGNVGVGDPAVVEALAEALRDKEAIVRRDALRALAKQTTLSEAIKAQLRAMAESDRDSLVREYASRVLAHFGIVP